MNPYETARLPYAGSATGVAERVTSFLRVVYGWMFAGLAVTATVAWLVAGTPALVMAIASNRIAFWGLALAQLGMVFYLSARVDKLAPGTAALLFLLYSGLTGVTMAFVLLVYTASRSRSRSSSPPGCSAPWRSTARSPRAAWRAWGSSCSWG